MKRLLPLIALALLLLAPAARGGDLEDRENAVQEAAAQVELLLVELDQTKDAQKRAELQLRVDAARANWNARKSELEVVRTQLAQATAEFDALRARAEEMQRRMTALHDEAQGRQRAFVKKGDLKRAEAMDAALRDAVQRLGEAHAVSDVLARTEISLREGDLSKVQLGLMEARDRLEMLQWFLGEREKMRRHAVAAERYAEDARRVRTAAEIAQRTEEAGAGIEAAKKTRALLVEAIQLASNPEDVKEIKRLQARMATFEEHAAKYHIAKGWLDRARALLETADLLEAQKALVQAKAHLQEAARRPLDDGSDTRPAPEFRTQRTAAADVTAALELARDLRATAATSATAAERVREALALQTAGETDLAAKREEVERLQKRVEEVRAEMARLQAARDALEKARPLIEEAEYLKALRAFEDAKNRLDAVNGLATTLRETSATMVAISARIDAVKQKISDLKARGVSDDHVDLQHRYHQLEVLSKHLADARKRSDRPVVTSVRFANARRAILESALADTEAKLATLTGTYTGKHPEVRRLQHETAALKKQLAELEDGKLETLVVRDLEGVDPAVLQPYDPESGETPPNLRVVTDEDGRFTLLGGKDGKHRVHIVSGDLEIAGRIVDEDGEPIKPVKVTEPVTVTKTAKSTVRRVWTPHDAKLRKQIDHLKKAAALLREAGQDDEAKRLEDKAKYLQAQLGPSRVYTTGATNGEVMRAIGDLRTEVRALREEVKELKALILQDR